MILLPNIKYHEQILFFITFGLVVRGIFTSKNNKSEENYKNGLIAALIVSVVQSTLKGYEIFQRPNQAFWRGVFKICQIHLLILVFLAYQTPPDARKLMALIYPELGKPVPKSMHTYDDDCEITWANFVDNLDHYYFIHWFNNFILTLVIRDGAICHIYSILIEILELTFQHRLPHFRECWWDHVFVDVLLSNVPAIILGQIVLKLCKIQEYDFFGRHGKKSFRDWDIWKCHKRFISLWMLIGGLSASFLNSFFIINGLWIPPKNALNLFRLVVWFFLANMCIKEGYQDITTFNTPQRKHHPISGKARWVCTGIVLLETICSIKFSEGAGNLTDDPTPMYKIVPWVLVLSSNFLFYVYLRFKPGHTTLYGPQQLQSNKTAKKQKEIEHVESSNQVQQQPKQQKQVQNKNETQAKGEVKQTQPKQNQENQQKSEKKKQKQEKLKKQ